MIEPLHETPGGRCSDLLLDRHLAGELDDSRADALEKHLAHSGPCRARYDALAADREAFLARAPRLTVIPLGRAPQAPAVTPTQRPPTARRPLFVIGALAMAASVMVLLPRTEVDPTTRTKGGGLVAYRAHGDAVDVLGEGGLVVPGDRLRFAFPASLGRYVGVVGQDESGAVSLYFPSGVDGLAEVADDAAPLPGAIALDGTPGRERLFGFSCGTNIPVSLLLDAVKRALPGTLPDVEGCEASRLTLEKPGSPSRAP